MHSYKLPTKQKDNIHAQAQFAFEAIGTQWQISLFEPINAQKGALLQKQLQQRIADFDATYSRFRGDSLIAKIAHAAGRYTLPSDARPLFDIYEKLYEVTNGQVTPLVGQLLVDAGYDASYSLQPGVLRPVPRWEDVLVYDFPTLTVRQPVLLDVGAAGKGYAVDIVSKLLQQHGVHQFCVDAGGDMYYANPHDYSLQVGLENPNDQSEAIGVADVPPAHALCGSAGNRRTWGKYHHIMHPHELYSPRHIKAVWTIASSCMLADALSTCLFFVPPAQLAKQYTFEYAIVYQDDSLVYSPHFPGTFFS